VLRDKILHTIFWFFLASFYIEVMCVKTIVMSRLNVLIVDMWYHFLIKSNNTTLSRLKEFYKAVRILHSFVLISFITVIVMSEPCRTRCTSADGLLLPKTIEYNEPRKQLIISCRHLCHTKVFEVGFLFLFLLHLFISNTFLTACVSFFHLIKIIECFLNKRMTFWQSLYTYGTYASYILFYIVYGFLYKTSANSLWFQ
jgi:hypothetical protein